MNRVLDDAKGRKAKELVQDYVRREPDAVNLVDELLTNAGASMDGLMADALAEKLDDIERIDRLISIVESRRNASLHEIERRRAVLGATLRRSVQEIEDGEFEVIETTPAQGENVACRATTRSRPTARMRGPAPARRLPMVVPARQETRFATRSAFPFVPIPHYQRR